MSDYWENRAAWDMYHQMEDAEKTAQSIARVYRSAAVYLNLSAEGIFEKYKTKHKLSETEAWELLNKMQDNASLDELLRELKDDDSDKTKQQLRAELEAPAYRVRMERLQSLMQQVDAVMQNVYRQERQYDTEILEKLGESAYYHSIYNMQKRTGLGFSFSHISQKQIDQVLNMNWSGKHFSKRIWGNTEELAETLKEEMLVSLLTGRTDRETAEVISNRFNVGAMKARRLVRTESCFMSGELTARSYKECKVEKYRYVAVLDLCTSEVCRGLDGQTFPVSERQAGKNYPPMHPWCRSTTIPDIDEETLVRMKRAAYNPATGRTEKVPANMTYQEWYEKYVEGDAKAQEKEVEKSDGSDILDTAETKEVADVHTVGKINRDIYKCITEDITTDEVVITDNQIQHIKERHPNDYERFSGYFSEIVAHPDYIISANKPDTAVILKEIVDAGEKFQTVLRLCTSKEPAGYKNSIITFLKIDEKRWNRYLRTKEILYKKE